MEAANVREWPAVASRKGPLFDIRGSVLAMGKREQATVYRNGEKALAPADVHAWIRQVRS